MRQKPLVLQLCNSVCSICSPSQRRQIMLDKFADLLVEELQINRKDITLDAELSNDLGINSIELADLVMLCEDKFGIVIEDDDIRGFTTVGDVVKYLESLN